MGYRPATFEDVVTVSRQLRVEDIQEALALYGVLPALYLPLHYEEDETYALVGKSGRVCGIAGTYPMANNPITGQVWMVSTPELEDNQTEFLRGSKAFIELLHQNYPILHNYVDARQTVHLKWLKWCGFRAIALKNPWGVAGLPFYEMIRIQ